LYHRLNKFKNVIAGDYKNFDGSLNGFLFEQALKVKLNWYRHWNYILFFEQAHVNGLMSFTEFRSQNYGEYEQWVKKSNIPNIEMLPINRFDVGLGVVPLTFEETQICRAVLFDEMTHTTSVLINLVIQTMMGNPSGNIITVDVNTICNELIMVCAFLNLKVEWLTKKMKEDYRLYMRDNLIDVTYRGHTRDTIYGDDNVISVSDIAAEFFYPQRICSWLSNRGITYGSARKDGSAFNFEKLEDVTFLKRRFFKHEQYDQLILAPIDQDTIRELTNWIRKGPNDYDAMYENLRNSLRFSFHWGRNFFAKHKRAINDALSEVGRPWVDLTYEECELDYFSEVF